MNALAVAGGTYIERCEVPRWSELFGSGTRAAAALSQRGVSIVLHTCIGKQEASLLTTCAASFGFVVEPEIIESSVGFHYLHSLSPPDLQKSEQLAKIRLSVACENILRFGMVEGTAVVHGDNVVYDPQSPYAPELFRKNGSTAKRLAVVLNRGESAHLTGKSDVNQAGVKLLSLEDAEVVIIKDGPRGATVFTAETVTEIPAYRTHSSWLLGSGDVFSAVFSYSWMIEKKLPVQAANEASMATAFYCQSKTLPIPVPLPEGATFHMGPISRSTSSHRVVYLAGPFQSLMQLWCIDEVRRCLKEQGFDVFSPYHAFGLGRKSKIAQASLESIQTCDLVFAILDGYDPNTVYEVGYARALGKPVVAFSASKSDNLNERILFEDDGFQVLEDLPTAIYACAWV